MVDAAASFGGKAAADPTRAAPSTVRGAAVGATAAGVAAYAALCEHATVAPAQSAAWIRAWIAEAQPDFLIAEITEAGMPVFALALEVVRTGPFRIARFMSGSHANGNFAPLARVARPPSRAEVELLVAEIRRERPDIDMLSLERMAEAIAGRPNPLLALPARPSPNLALAVDLSGGFDALLERSSGKRKRKKHRSQIRKFEAAGGMRLIEAATPAEVERLLDAFFAMKRARFARMGVADVFAPPSVKAFFRRLFTEALGEKAPPFTLDGLEVGGHLRAATGASRCGDRLICEFGAIAEDDLSHASPGDFLFFENIKAACDAGFAVYDFSVGDEPYKRLWCDMDSVQFDVLVPLTAKGRLLASATRAKSRLKARIKKHPLAWRLVKTLRRRKGEKIDDSRDD